MGHFLEESLVYTVEIIMGGFGVLLAALVVVCAQAQDTLYAHCDFRAKDAVDMMGTVDFRQKPGEEIEIKVDISGLPTDDGYFVHALHVHSYGDFSDSCLSFEGHWNPFGTNHGAPFDPPTDRHPGDFGNMPKNPDGTIQITFTDYFATLSGETNIVGHGMVLHEHYDDLGRSDDPDSLVNGAAGGRYGCCVITYSDDRHW